MMAYSQAQNKATQKYQTEKLEQLRVWVRKDGPQCKAAVQAAANAAGESLASYITGAIAQRMERDGKGGVKRADTGRN